MGKDASLDQNDEDNNGKPNEKNEKNDKVKNDDVTELQRRTTEKVAKIEPVAGPWANVAKNIQ